MLVRALASESAAFDHVTLAAPFTTHSRVDYRSHPHLVLASPPTPLSTLVITRSKHIPKQPSYPARRAPPHRCRRSGSPQTRRPTPQKLIISKGRRPTSLHVAHGPALARSPFRTTTSVGKDLAGYRVDSGLFVRFTFSLSL